MPRLIPAQYSFTSGELTPLLQARPDLDQYKSGASVMENYLILRHGGAKGRAGTRYVAETKDSTQKSIAVPFEYSTTQAYILELGNLYFRIYKNSGRIENPPGTPVEVSSPWASADLPQLKFAQSADTLYVVHGNYWPQKITRSSHTSWSISSIAFVDGPYLAENLVTTALLQASATANAANITITGAANNGSGLIRITAAAHGYSTNDWVKISGVLGTTEANGYWKITVIDVNTFDLQTSTFTSAYTSGGKANKLGTLTASGTNTDGTAFAPFVTGPTLVAGQFPKTSAGGAGHVGSYWRVKASTVYGYCRIANVNSTTVAVVDIFTAFDGIGTTSKWREGLWSFVRGFPAAVTLHEQRLVFGSSGLNPDRLDGSVSADFENFTPGTTDGDPISFRLVSNQVPTIRWIASSRRLIVGTVGGEFVLSGGGTDNTITPSNIQARQVTTYGSAAMQPLRIGQDILFIQRAAQKLLKMAYEIYTDSYDSDDLTLLSEHIMSGGINYMAWQQELDRLALFVRADGQLVSMTYLLKQKVIGWARHITDGLFESVAVIPHPNLDKDQAWVIVNRTINGVTKRYVEWFDINLRVDAGLSYDGTQNGGTLTPGATTGTSVTFTSSVAAFAAGDVGKDIVLTSAIAGVSNSRARIITFTDSTHVVCNIVNNFPNTSPIAAGGWALAVVSVSGLSHLEGKSVQIVGDGAVYPAATVTSGAVTLDGPRAYKIDVGLKYLPKLVTLEPVVQTQDGTSLGRPAHWAKVYVSVYNTQGLSIQTSDAAQELPFRSAGNPMDSPPPVTSGPVKVSAKGWSTTKQLTISQPNPLPCTVLAVWGWLDVGEP